MPLLRYIFLGIILCFSLSASARNEKLKVAFVYQDAANKPGWNSQHDAARQAVEKFFGDKIQVAVADRLQPGPDAERIITGLARANHGIIFVTSPELSAAALEASKRFPDIYFEIAAGTLQGENISTFSGRFYQARYLFGQIAARETQSGTIGFVGISPDAANICEINAFMLGAQSVDPEIKLAVAFTGNPFNPAGEAHSARAVIGAGADVITYNTHTPATAQIAEQNGVKVFADAADMSSFAPQMQIGALIHDWSGYYIRRVSTVLEGKWAPSQSWIGIREGIVTFGNFRNISDKTRNLALEARQNIIDDKLKVFSGPVYDADGVQRLKKDEVASDDMLKAMNWYVKGKIAIVGEKQL